VAVLRQSSHADSSVLNQWVERRIKTYPRCKKPRKKDMKIYNVSLLKIEIQRGVH
jgi:hypothetical protein